MIKSKKRKVKKWFALDPRIREENKTYSWVNVRIPKDHGVLSFERMGSLVRIYLERENDWTVSKFRFPTKPKKKKR